MRFQNPFDLEGLTCCGEDTCVQDPPCDFHDDSGILNADFEPQGDYDDE